MNELRSMGIEIPGDHWRTNNPDDILLNRPRIRFVQEAEDEGASHRRRSSVKGILLCCSTGGDTPLPCHYRVCMDGTIVRKHSEDRIPAGFDEAGHPYLWVEMEIPELPEPAIEAFTPAFFQTQAWRSFGYTAELCASLCKKYKLNPEGRRVLVSHAEMLVAAQDERSPESSWTPFGLGMSDIRITVGRILKDDKRKKKR